MKSRTTIVAALLILLVAACQPETTPTPLPETQVLSTSTATPTADNTTPEWIQPVQDYLENLAEEDSFSGAVLIAQEGQPVLQVAYGMADRSLAIPNQIDTKFNLGSMDKMFTAVAILQLMEQDRLSLQDPAIQYLPDYPNPEILGSITIHQLLTHTSGMGNYFDSDLYLDLRAQLRSPSDHLPLFADTGLLFSPGIQFGYSNAGFIILGLIIESISGQSYYDYVRENIFEPAGMTDTACYELDAHTTNLAIGYTAYDWDGNDTGQLNDNSFMLPIRGASAGGGYSTVQDLLAFAKALSDYRLLSPESTDLLITGKIKLRQDLQYAYGFFDRMVGDQRVVGHSGGFPGICSFMDMYPESGHTVIVLSNSDSGCLLVLNYLAENPFE